MIKVSVCITTYNLEKYIEQTLNSILSQKTSFDFEILVGDDCSTDGTREILLAYKERFPEKIKLHLQQKNVGVNKNDYDLIYLAHGEYIAWCDGDDYWIDEYKLEKQVRILDENPQYSCVHTLWRNFYEQESRFEDVYFEQYDWERILNGRQYIEKLLTWQDSGCRFSSLMNRREILLNALGTEPSILTEVDHLQNDFAIFCLLVYDKPTFLMKEETVVYRIRPESLSMTKNLQNRYRYCLKGLNLTVYLLKKYAIGQETIQIALHPHVSFLFRFIFENIKVITDFYKIKQQLSIVNYKYSIGQRLLVLTFKYSFLRPFVSLLIHDKKSKQ